MSTIKCCLWNYFTSPSITWMETACSNLGSPVLTVPVSTASCHQLLYSGKVTRNGCFSRYWSRKENFRYSGIMAKAGPILTAQCICSKFRTPGVLPDPPAVLSEKPRLIHCCHILILSQRNFYCHLLFMWAIKRNHSLTCRYVVPSIDLHCPFLIGGADELDTSNSNIYWKDELYLFYSK